MRPKLWRVGLLAIALLGLALLLAPKPALAAACNSIGTGNWNTIGTWSCGHVPVAADTVTIVSPNIVTVNVATANVTSITVNLGATLTIATFNVSSAGAISVSGTINGTGTATGTITGPLTFNSGSTYIHAQDGGTIPTATWNGGSEVQVTGVTGTAPAGLGQSFANFKWNSAQTARCDLGGTLTTIRGNFTVLQTSANTTCGTGIRSLVLDARASGTTTVNIGGDFIVSGTSSINLNRGTTGTSGTVLVNLGGNFNFAGMYLASQNSQGAATTSTVNLTGSGKTFSEAATGGWLDFTCGIAVLSDVDFVVKNGASITLSTALPLPGTNTNSLTVESGGTLNTGTNIVSGSGPFTLASGGTLGIGSAAGIDGNITTTGTKSFNAGATYVYNGTVAQTTGTSLPSGATTITGGLQINNSLGVTLTNSETVSGTLTLTSGVLSLGAGANTLTASGTVNCNGGTITSTTGLVSYTGAALQNVCPGSYVGLTFSASTKTLNGAINIAGAFSPGAATGNVVTGSTVTFSQAAANQTVPAFNYNNLTFSGGTKTLANAGTVGIAGIFTPAGIATTVTGSTVSFNGSGTQTIPAFTFNNLQTAGTGTKTASAAVTVNGTLTVGSGTVYSQTAANLTSGTITVSSGGAFKYTGTGIVTIGAGGLSNSGTFQVDGGGSPCGGARATITGAAAPNRPIWTGGGAFQLADVTINNQNNTSTAGTITAWNANTTSGTNTNFTLISNCTGPPAYPTAVRLASFTATAHGGRVLLRWQTAMETNNIGFRLYREAGDASSPVTAHLISGSALMVGLRATVSGGRSYVWWDDLPAGGDAATTRYWLADVDLRGEQTFHGPVVPKPSDAPAPDVRNAPQLQQLAGLTGASASTGSGGQSGPAGRVLRRLSPTTPSTTAVQWTLASARALKIGISQPGWYQVTGQDLIDHGLGNVDPTRLQFFADGQQIPLVTRGVARGRSIVPQSTVEFYATGLDSQWSSERSYWLAAGDSAGRRIGRVNAKATTAAPASFAFSVASAPKVIYFPALMNGDGDKYFGPIVSTDASAPTTLALDVRNPDGAPAGQAALDVAVQGVMDGLHIVAVLLNGNPVGQIEFNGQELGTAHLLLDQSTSLIEGSNQISLWAEGGEMDLSLVASVGLTYWRRYVADGDVLSMTAPGDSHLVVSGFVSPHIRVMDVTDPENPYELSAAVQNDGSGYAVTTDVAGAGTCNLLAFTDEKIASPASLKSNIPSSWHSADKAANLVVLTNAAVAGALAPLVQLRQGQGYVVAVVDVEDVYDEFSFGNKTPQALRDFLSLASSTWRKRPGFVLLAGSASADPRNFLGYGNFDLVPTKFVNATYNYAASDDWFVDFNDDGLPEMAIGRLPVRDSTQAAAVVQKLVGYGHAGGADWRKTAVLVSDNATSDFDFPAATNAVAAQIPTSMFLTQIFRGDFADDSLAHAALLGAFNQGALLVNYMGHSSETAWQGNLLSMDDVPLLTNGSRLPFVSSMTCWTGWFADPYGETLGESLLKTPQGGAIAVWASSGLTEPAGQLTMDAEFMRLLFAAKKPTIGEATARAKTAVSDLDVRHTWILLGDPTTKLQ